MLLFDSNTQTTFFTHAVADVLVFLQILFGFVSFVSVYVTDSIDYHMTVDMVFVGMHGNGALMAGINLFCEVDTEIKRLLWSDVFSRRERQYCVDILPATVLAEFLFYSDKVSVNPYRITANISRTDNVTEFRSRLSVSENVPQAILHTAVSVNGFVAVYDFIYCHSSDASISSSFS